MVKRRLAFASVALLLLATLVVLVRGYMVNECVPQYKLILADGEEFELSGHGRVGGSSATLLPFEGHDGLASLSHVSDDIYGVPGKLLASVSPDMRIVTLTASLYSLDGTQRDLLRAKGALMDGLRWDRGDRDKDPITLRATLGDDSWDLGLNYQSLIESRQGRHGLNEAVAVRLAAYDPTWRSATESSLTLDWGDEFTVLYCIGRESGIWTPLGPPAAVAAGAGGGIDVFDTAIDPSTGDVYFGGDFRNWNNLAVPGLGADHIVRWNVSSQAWEVVGNGLNERVTRLYFGPDDSLYVGGLFTNGSGGAGDANADYLARYDRDTDAFVNVGGGPGAGVGIGVAVIGVWGIAFGYDGVLYVGGDFINWSAAGNDFLVQYDTVAGWSQVGGVSPSSVVREAQIMSNGDLVVGGLFGAIGADGDCNHVGEWDGTDWFDLDTGTDGNVNAMAVAPDGTLYIGGAFIQAGSGPTTVNYIAAWNGVTWHDLDGGLDNQVWHIEISNYGELWVGGDFTQAGPLTLTDHVARWNGFSWAHIGVDLPGVPTVDGISFFGDNIYFGFNTTGTAYVSGDNIVSSAGSAPTYPTIEIKNQGTVQVIRNETTGEEMLFAPMQIFDGEIVEITTNKRTGRDITSTWRPLGRLGDLLPPGMGDWKLESGPRVAYGGVDGANLVTVFITDADAREFNDGGNQLSGWDDITGISQDNTDLGRLYASIVVVGGGFNRVDFYMDAARTQQVAETDPYNAPGAEPILEVNDSGLGGTITIDAVGAGDVDIYARYTIVTATWYNRWWSLSEAVRDAVT